MTLKSKIIVPVAVSVYVLDRLTKQLILDKFELGQSVEVVKGYFDITYVQNLGAAFGFLSMLDGGVRLPFFFVTTLLALGLLAYFVRKTGAEAKLTLVSLAMIIAGAAGNLTDRLMYGYVVDFIDWHVGIHHWPAFNIADCGITVGIALLGYEIIVKGESALGG
ncbi:MAG: signal peptidase II [Nitrospirae bacterium]|nr:signal peptidase II [Nitrospirota bacterium]